MSESTVYRVEDFQDLPFDVTRHAEALQSFAALHLAPASIRPALHARDIVFVRVPACKFRFGVTSDPSRQAMATREAIAAFRVIHETSSPSEAEQVRGDVERYYLRHYPGRALAAPQALEPECPPADCVYVICYPPAD